jgi:hypothetical protein
VETISPELALVDEQLDSTARRELPDAPDCLASPERSSVEPAVARAHSPRGRRAAVALVALLALLSIALGALFAQSRGAGEPAAPEASASSPSSETARRLTRSGSPVELRWRPVRGASFYNVIFWRNGVRALDLWPRTASVRIPDGKLEPGVYQWFVYPSFGKVGSRRYGQVAARGTVRV